MQSGKDRAQCDNSFPYWQSLSHGDPSVSLALASSPKRGAKGVDSPREALPLLGEVPSAHTGERGLRGRLRCKREKTERSADHSFPHWHSLSHGALSVTFGDSSPKGGAKGVDENRRVGLYFFRNEPCRKRRSQPKQPVIPRRAKPDVGIRFSLRRTKIIHSPKGMRIATSLVPRSSQ